jgi:hypothetical protein
MSAFPLFSERFTTRRDWLKISTAFGVSCLIPGLDLRAANERGPERAKSLITLWMNGGPSQLDSWDPHPGTIIGGDVRGITTSVPGLEIAHTLPMMADRMHKLNVIRSLVSKEGDHERGSYFVKTGFRPETTITHPALGAIISKELPAPGIDIPHHIAILSNQYPPRGGYLGDQYDAFKITSPGSNLTNMKARVQDKRMDQRMQNLDLLTQSFKHGRDSAVDHSLHYDTLLRAHRMMSSPQLKAFDLSEESLTTQAKYGATEFGKGCLIARRLISAGVRSVEVTLTGFDSHTNNFEIQKARSTELDPAFAALVKELEEQDLFDSTIILCIGEFGRTPKINPLGGRDHWPSGFSAVIGGGGLAAGQVIGETDPTGENSTPTDPHTVQDLYATILKQMGIDHEAMQMTPIGRPIPYTEGKPIARLLPV